MKLEEPRLRFIETLATGDLIGAVAGEVVEHHGDDIPAIRSARAATSSRSGGAAR